MIRLPTDIFTRLREDEESAAPLHTGLSPKWICDNTNIRISCINVLEEKDKNNTRLNEANFGMCYPKIADKDPIYCNESDWWGAYVTEGGVEYLAGIVCMNKRHPELSAVFDDAEGDDLIHLSEIEIAPDFRGDAYKGPKKDFTNPHLCSNIINTMKKVCASNYKYLTLQAYTEEVKKTYLHYGFTIIDEEIAKKGVEWEKEQKDLPFAIFSAILDNPKFYIVEHPFMYYELGK